MRASVLVAAASLATTALAAPSPLLDDVNVVADVDVLNHAARAEAVFPGDDIFDDGLIDTDLDLDLDLGLDIDPDLDGLVPDVSAERITPLFPWWPIPWRRRRPVQALTTYGYDVATGAIMCRPTDIFGRVSVHKFPRNRGRDKTVLFTFRYPQYVRGRQCRIVFDLDRFATVRGTGQLDLFSSNAAAPGCTEGWGPGNQRGEHLGRLQARVNAPAEWIKSYSPLTSPGPCPAPGTVQAYELVGVGDNDDVTWRPSAVGLKVLVN
jgi:hypothetical protein